MRNYYYNLSIINIKTLKSTAIILIALLFSSLTHAQITQVGSVTTNYATNATSITISKPTGVAVGDILILNVVKYGDSADPSISGWTTLGASAIGGDNNTRGYLAYKVITSSSEPSSYTIASNSTADYIEGAIIAYSGVDTSSPIDAQGSFVIDNTVNASTISLPAITTSSTNTLVLQLAMSYRTNNNTERTFSSWTTATAGTLSEEYDYGGGNRVCVGAASLSKATAGTTGTGTITLSGTRTYRGGMMLALKQAPTSGLYATPTSISNFSYIEGNGPSTTQAILVSGSGLSSNVTVTAPSNFEISLTDSPSFSAQSSLTLTPSSGTLSSTSVYIRMKSGLSIGTIGPQNLTVASTGFTTQNIALSGEVVELFYCDMTANTSFETSITSVSFNTITQTSAKPSGYSDYSAVSTNATLGTSYNLSVNANTDGDYTTHTLAWIDWNRDGDFEDSGESYDLGTAINVTNGATSLSPLSITVPTTATIGTTRMRVATRYNDDPTLCDTDFDGETEDYSINVLSNQGITVSTNALSGFTYPYGLGPSAEKTFTVTGSQLTANIKLTPAADYQISTGSGASFVPTSLITLTATGGNVSTTTIYVRLKSGLAIGTYSTSEIINVTSTGSTSKTVTCSGTVTTGPSITATPTALSGFSYQFTAGPSAQQSFNVSGSNLVANVIVTPPSGYEISTTSGSGFQSTALTLTQSGGTLSSTTVYIRLKSSLGVGSYIGNTVLSTTGFSTNVSCSGSVTDKATLTTNLSLLSGFIYTLGSGPSGAQSFMLIGSNLANTTNNVVVTAPTNFEISNSSGSGYASSLQYTPSGGSLSRTIYARLKTGLSVGSYGPSNVSISASGAVIKTVALKGSVVNAATLLVSNTSLNGFGYLFGYGPTAPQKITVSGASLSSDIVITPPSNYEISLTSGSGYQSTAITLARSSNRVNPTIIYIRLKAGLTANTYNQNLSVVSGALSSPVTLNGIVYADPLITAGGGGDFCSGSDINLTSDAENILNLYWTGPNDYYSTEEDPTISNADDTMSGTYTVTGNVIIGGNLITNGDFELGDVGFSSSYGSVVEPFDDYTLWDEGLYAVTELPSDVHGNFSSGADHTSAPGSLQMVINGNTTAGVVIWTQSVSVIPGADYEFNYWLQTVVATAPSQLQLYVNGVAAGPVYTASSVVNTWTQFIYNTNAGSENILNLELINQNTVANGNDFALDDIVLQQILPATSTTDVSVNSSLPVSLTIDYSPTTVYDNTPVTFTAYPVNPGSTPTYVWTVNDVEVGTNSTEYTYIPSDGDVVKCELTSSYACATGNPAEDSEVMTVLNQLNYWMGGTSTDWGTASNWTANFVPLTGDNVEYATVANYGTAAVRDLQLDIDRTIGSLINATTKRLIIPTTKTLIVNNTVTTDGNVDRILIEGNSTDANGSLIFNNTESLPVSATVEMYSRASWDLTKGVNQKYNWQYFGIPFRSLDALPTFYGSYVRTMLESGTTISNHWQALTNESVLQPFIGYELCQEAPKTYELKGQLTNSDYNSGQLAVTTATALYPGQHLFANPYTAAIKIKQIEFGTSMEAIVYLYQTGAFNQWDASGTTKLGTVPGTYIACPKLTSGLAGIPGQVPSMSSMLVVATASNNQAYIEINYDDVIEGDTSLHRVKSVNTNTSTIIEVKSENSYDKMWLFSNDGFTRNFDNGNDGRKIIGSALSAQIYAVEADGNYQINAVDNINNSTLAFQAGQDTEYELVFTHENTATKYNKIFLHDLVENTIVDITESGSTYSFEAQSTPSATDRFRIITKDRNSVDEINSNIQIFTAKNSIYIQNDGTENGEIYIYDITGKLYNHSKMNKNDIKAISINSSNIYIVKVVSPSEEKTEKIYMQ